MTETIPPFVTIPHSLCSPCNQSPETVEHTLLLCPWTRKIWKDTALNINISAQGLSRFEVWLDEVEHTSASFELLAFFLWQIWKARNHFVFREKKPDPEQVVDEAVAMQQNHDR